MNEFVLLILEKVLEAIYFSLFLIFGKGIKNKKLLFIGIMVFQYLILKQFIKFNVLFQIIYTFLSFINLKVLYKDKAQITDIFLFASASLILIVLSIACAVFVPLFGIKYIIMLIINRILMFLVLFLIKNKIENLYKKFYLKWNRNKNNTTGIKSLTLRNISVIVFNLMFYIINISLAYIILTKWGDFNGMGR